jgi:hypothetical protein
MYVPKLEKKKHVKPVMNASRAYDTLQLCNALEVHGEINRNKSGTHTFFLFFIEQS